MSETGTTAVVVESKPQEPAAPVAEIKAAQAEASAVTAQEAAASAVVLADTAAAQVTAQAATEVNGYQERLASCEARMEQLDTDLRAHRSATEAQMAEANSLLSSIRQRLEQPPPNPKNQSEATSDEAPKEPKPPRRSAHRWI